MQRRTFLAGLSAATAVPILGRRSLLAQSGAITDAYLAEQAALVDFGGMPGALLIAEIEPDGTVLFAGVGAHPDGSAPAATDVYRVGSNTKTFTSTLILMLVAEGAVDLDSPASDYLTSHEIPAGITVRQLLNHTSGLANYMDTEAYYTAVYEDPAHAWVPSEMLALVADLEPAEPGTQFLYTNTNYIYLGALIEDVTGSGYVEVLRERLLEPLELASTYLGGFEEGPEPVGTWMYGTDSYVPMTTDYTAAATSTWSAGALVSTALDLHIFSTALHAGDLIPDELRAEMMNGGENGYGLGLMPFSDQGQVWGHLGSMPGYQTLLAHSADTGRTGFWAITNDAVDPSPSTYDLVSRLGLG